MQSNDLLVIAAIVGIVIFLIIFITRWLFKINKTEAYQKASLELLKEMAQKAGVEEEKIRQAINHFNNPDTSL